MSVYGEKSETEIDTKIGGQATFCVLLSRLYRCIRACKQVLNLVIRMSALSETRDTHHIYTQVLYK